MGKLCQNTPFAAEIWQHWGGGGRNLELQLIFRAYSRRCSVPAAAAMTGTPPLVQQNCRLEVVSSQKGCLLFAVEHQMNGRRFALNIGENTVGQLKSMH